MSPELPWDNAKSITVFFIDSDKAGHQRNGEIVLFNGAALGSEDWRREVIVHEIFHETEMANSLNYYEEEDLVKNWAPIWARRHGLID
ncbi:MAG: hypothetical protein EP340_00780 [Alphaproteobacteria bacterium]|nr:MAG: hypothetical protein EP340_00780 [Alphaproteobacteria bacterium]